MLISLVANNLLLRCWFWAILLLKSVILDIDFLLLAFLFVSANGALCCYILIITTVTSKLCIVLRHRLCSFEI